MQSFSRKKETEAAVVNEVAAVANLSPAPALIALNILC